MQETIACLVELQKIDLRILKIKQERDVFPAQVQKLDTQLTKQRDIFEEQDLQLQKMQQTIQEKQSTLDDEESKLKKWQKRLMETKNHREAAPLSREIEAQKRLNLESKEDIDRLKEDLKRLESEVEAVNEKLKAVESERDAAATNCEVKMAEFNAEMEGHIAQREQYTSQLTNSVLRKYTTLRKRRGGLAIVAAKDGSCMGCQMQLPPQVYNITMKMQSMTTCPSCKRMLFWSDGFKNGEAEDAPTTEESEDVS